MNSPARKPESPRIQLFLRIKHPHIDPDDISRALKLEPEYANKAGTGVTAKGTKKIHAESYWLAELPVPSIRELASWAARSRADISLSPSITSSLRSVRLTRFAGLYDVQILLWLKQLDDHAAFLKTVVDEGGVVTLVLQRPDRDAPLNIGPLLARRLADLEIGLEID